MLLPEAIASLVPIRKFWTIRIISISKKRAVWRPHGHAERFQLVETVRP
jgi:hypothetical protein